MRVSAATKAATRERILQAARQQFAARGFDSSTTRDIADAAGIASGTLFNYFATKEVILASLAAEALTGAGRRPNGDKTVEGSFEEDLFAHVMAGLQALRPLRKHLSVFVATALSPLAAAPADGDDSLRLSHLEAVAEMAKKHGQGELSSLALQLYWTLYTGVLLFWANDRSPKQEDTLALLDQSLAMFTGWLQSDGGTTAKGGTEPCPQPWKT
jgi:AcrR family transcriptional regulator